MIIFEMLGLGILDSLNPVTIATMVVIIPAVKQKKDSLLFIISTYLVYSLSGIVTLLGLDTLFSKYMSYIIVNVTNLFTGIKDLIAIIFIGVALYYSYKLYQKAKTGRLFEYTPSPLMVKLTAPLSIFVLGIYSTFMDIPTALPYFGFISILTANKVSFLLAVFMLLAYCFVYISPMILVYIFSNNPSFFKFQNGMLKTMNFLNQIILPLFLLIAGVFLLYS